MIGRLWRRLRAKAKFFLSIAASMLICEAAFALPDEDSVRRFEGRYTGTIYWSAEGSTPDWPAPDKGTVRDNDGRRSKSAGSDGRATPGVTSSRVPVRSSLSLSSTGDRWRMELRYVDDPPGVPLPPPLVMSFAKSQGPVSDVTLDGVVPQSWMAWAVRGRSR